MKTNNDDIDKNTGIDRTQSIEAFGGCPDCGGNDGFLNLGSDHWFICAVHRTKWCVGSNWFRCWRWETKADWQRNFNELQGFREITPVFEVPPNERPID